MVKKLGSQKGLSEAVLEELAGNSVTICSNLSAVLSSQHWNIKIQRTINALL